MYIDISVSEIIETIENGKEDELIANTDKSTSIVTSESIFLFVFLSF